MTSPITTVGHGFASARDVLIAENKQVLAAVDVAEWDSAALLISDARAVFVIGSGRSGLAAQMAAMRLMHLGLQVHVAGEVTAPAVGAGDVVVAVSGSGTTAIAVAAAETANNVGATVVAVTTAPQSPLAELAARVLVVPAADKQDHGNAITAQYAGSLFEQSVLLAFDALFHSMWSSREQSAENLWSRHANIG
ncbi:SIS domain-containing protein [Rhodococcus sp. BP-252]|uniref:6-phospho-3-hexuloisomerase n=1 Tax=unclassified Rhodococcus (in: high G+C Gram-positive bacteria) TaxID=192944 RepID=UPI001C9A77EA|nr:MULTISPECIES: 6-phospho-3-hexuloisomerase [unclassified Rhodococcus (in: high G+C Gram-positive bacteria)]MBY6414672.1 SIS domain-containing protein [Rhodococcus sp. BP-320]MBY6419497.1 SIS domain-containing protein [Rhodococcus sp. BP-321]MBY6424491.1 SIS domain-containing protein [Rhodococcus sp. BP-324]MBY6429508.1 SIS domain-containing protein [Rhodococcus sp. BP-323]MBY6434501.1 SIS domain-containing protein [Rhodococcus sp. BP-322]